MRNLLPGTEVTLAFLEFMPPDIDAAVNALAARGARHIRVVPVFLAQAGHVKRELPARVAALRASLSVAHPDLIIELEPAIGEQGEVINVTNIRRTEYFFDKMIETIKIHVGKELTGQVADGQSASPQKGLKQIITRKVPLYWFLRIRPINYQIEQGKGGLADDTPP